MAFNAANNEAPWGAPDPQESLRYLQALATSGIFDVNHPSAPNVQSVVQAAFGGLRKELEKHTGFLHTEHVQYKTDHALGRKMVRFWTCISVTAHPHRVWDETENHDADQIYYDWSKLYCLPPWEIKKVWVSNDGWLLVARPEENQLLAPTHPAIQLDQNSLLVETIQSESSHEEERSGLASSMAQQVIDHLVPRAMARERSRSPRARDAARSSEDVTLDPPM